MSGRLLSFFLGVITGMLVFIAYLLTKILQALGGA